MNYLFYVFLQVRTWMPDPQEVLQSLGRLVFRSHAVRTHDLLRPQDESSWGKIPQSAHIPVVSTFLLERHVYSYSPLELPWNFGLTCRRCFFFLLTKMFLNTIGRSHGQMTMARLVKALEGGWRLTCPPSCSDKVRHTLLLLNILLLCSLHSLTFCFSVSTFCRCTRRCGGAGLMLPRTEWILKAWSRCSSISCRAKSSVSCAAVKALTF